MSGLLLSGFRLQAANDRIQAGGVTGGVNREGSRTTRLSRSVWPQVPWVERRTKLALAESQKEAVRVALASGVLVITGGPGVGKNDDRQLHPQDPSGEECSNRAP